MTSICDHGLSRRSWKVKVCEKKKKKMKTYIHANAVGKWPNIIVRSFAQNRPKQRRAAPKKVAYGCHNLPGKPKLWENAQTLVPWLACLDLCHSGKVGTKKKKKKWVIRAYHTSSHITHIRHYILNEDTQLVIRAIGVSHTACKDEFRQNIRSHSWSAFLFLPCGV